MLDGDFKAIIAFATPARGAPDGVCAEDGGDAEEVPDSVAPVALGADLDHKVGRNGGKRVRHPDRMGSRREGDVVRFREPFVSRLHSGDRQIKSTGGLAGRWRQGGRGECRVDKVADLAVYVLDVGIHFFTLSVAADDFKGTGI